MAICCGYIVDWQCPHHGINIYNWSHAFEDQLERLSSPSSMPDLIASHSDPFISCGSPMPKVYRTTSSNTWCRRRHAYCVEKTLRISRERIPIRRREELTTAHNLSDVSSTSALLDIRSLGTDDGDDTCLHCSLKEKFLDQEIIRLGRRWKEAGLQLRRISDEFSLKKHENFRLRNKHVILNKVEKFIASSFLLSILLTLVKR